MTGKKLALVLFCISCIRIAIAENRTSVIEPIQSNLNNWSIRGNLYKNKWTIGKATIDRNNPHELKVANGIDGAYELINSERGDTDIYTKKTFGDCIVELEVMLPKDSNSGIYLMGQYEVQIKDSYNKKRNPGKQDMGAICGYRKPAVNAAKRYGQWQTLRIEFKAPRFANGKRTEPAEFSRIILNGHTIHEQVKMFKGSSSGALKKSEVAKGPLMLQGGLGAVAYRKIKIRAFPKTSLSHAKNGHICLSFLFLDTVMDRRKVRSVDHFIRSTLSDPSSALTLSF